MAESQVKTRIVLLPGLHGTGALFQDFVASTPPGYEVSTITFPLLEPLSYQDLTDLVCERLLGDRSRLILLGESFSGPLALFVAERKPPGLSGVILVASFILPPARSWARFLPWKTSFRVVNALTKRLVEPSRVNGSVSVVGQIIRELHKVSPSVLADRVRSILHVNASNALIHCPVPILYLTGTKDLIVRKKCLGDIYRFRPDIHVRSIPSHHFLLQSVPSLIWQNIDWFVEKCSPVSKVFENDFSNQDHSFEKNFPSYSE